MAAGLFGCPKMTFDHISYHFRLFFLIFFDKMAAGGRGGCVADENIIFLKTCVSLEYNYRVSTHKLGCAKYVKQHLGGGGGGGTYIKRIKLIYIYLPPRRRPGTGDIATPTVRLSVRPSVRLSVRPSRLVFSL